MKPFSWLKWRLIEALAHYKRKRLEKKSKPDDTKFIDHGPSSRRKP